MSREWVLKAIGGLGLSDVEAEVYLFLAQTGPLKGRDIAKKLKLNNRQIYLSLKSLQAKGMVKATHEITIQYDAVSLEKVLDQFMKEKEEQAEALKASREELLSTWRSMIKENSATS